MMFMIHPMGDRSRITLLCLLIAGSVLQPALASFATLPERGPHHRTWRNASGSVYTELATGLHYRDEKRWRPTRERIRLNDGRTLAVADQGPHRAAFKANPASSGAVVLRAPDGQLFRSHVLGLAFLAEDDTTGTPAWLATIGVAQGRRLPPHRVIYPEALKGALTADLRYTYTRDGLEQDVILRNRPPSPKSLGLAPEQTVLALYTEFLEAPAPALAGYGSNLDFGSIRIAPGRAFIQSPGVQSPGDAFAADSLAVAKHWIHRSGRTFLVETIPYPLVASSTLHLPQAPGPPPSLGAGFPTVPNGDPGYWESTTSLALGRKAPAGFVMDYVMKIASLTNFVLGACQTYHVTGPVHLHGRTTIEGGAVIKLDPPLASLEVHGPLDCRTQPFQPAIFTARDDDSTGVRLRESTGRVSGFYGRYALALRDRTTHYDLHDLRVRHAHYGLAVHDRVAVTLSHSQLGFVSRGIAARRGSRVGCQNVLLHEAGHAFWLQGPGHFQAEHLTVHQVDTLMRYPEATLWLTNSLLAEVTNHVVYRGNAVLQVPEGNDVFRPAGGGRRYLRPSSPAKGAGTTRISPGLRQELSLRTTRPPERLTGWIRVPRVLRASLPGRTGPPDVGYHYDRLDHVIMGGVLGATRLELQEGVRVGMGGPGADPALRLEPGARWISRGHPLDYNQVIGWQAVQEGVRDPSRGGSFFDGTTGQALRGRTVQSRFTTFISCSDSRLLGPAMDHDIHLDFQDSIFHGGDMQWDGQAASDLLTWTNNECHEVAWSISPGSAGTVHFLNNLFIGGSLLAGNAGGIITFFDNVFLNTDLTQLGPLDHGYNAYLTGQNRWFPRQNSDQILEQAPAFLNGPVGAHYYQRDSVFTGQLQDRGSRMAGSAGLYHYTTTLDQESEKASRVDIGLHYLALHNGIPRDQDADELSNHEEDHNGNGHTELHLGETDWQSPRTNRFSSSIEGLDLFTPLDQPHF